MFGDEKEREGDDLDVSSDEIEDLDAPDKEGEDVKGGMPKIITKGCSCNQDCFST
jgi:hypothetical protein